MKSDTASTVSPSIFHEVMGPDAMILVFWMLRIVLSKKIFSFISPPSPHYILLLLILPLGFSTPLQTDAHSGVSNLCLGAWCGSGCTPEIKEQIHIPPLPVQAKAQQSAMLWTHGWPATDLLLHQWKQGLWILGMWHRLKFTDILEGRGYGISRQCVKW